MVRLKPFASILAVVSAAQAAQLLNFESQKDVIPDSYVVVMNDGVSSLEFETHVEATTKAYHASANKRDSSMPGGVQFKYDINGWRGYNGKFDKETLQGIVDDPRVKYVEPDRMARGMGWVTQKGAPSWGLGRISHRQPWLYDFVYEESAGAGVTVYALDSGVDINHPDFEGRAIWGANFILNAPDEDDHGHGTHTAATVAGKIYGVAIKANVVAVKVLNAWSFGPFSGIIAGIDWSIAHANQTNVLGKAVMNLSLGAPGSTALNEAATRVAEAGIFVAVAAGNSGEDAGTTTPASAEKVCTVGATVYNDTRAEWSNYGPAVAVFAPGDNILSAIPGNESDFMWGTSMAAPHVCGVAAALISAEGIETDMICDRIKQMSTAAVRDAGPNTTNKLLYNGSGK